MAMLDINFDIRLRVWGHAIPPDGIRTKRCTACNSRLAMHQPDPENPRRLLANCTCLECGIWFTLILSPDGNVSYMIRLPSVVEMMEAIARLGGGNGHAAGGG